ncbi:MAG: hypothetical protein AAF701_05070 [Pseudomonadota bacterium]
MVCIFVFLATPIWANRNDITPCHDIHGPIIGQIWEPWETYSKRYYNGQVRIALIEMHMRVALAIISPPFGEGGYKQCMIVGRNIGFDHLDFPNHTADYNPDDGMVFRFSVWSRFYDETTGLSPQRPDGVLVVTLNPTTGDIIYKREK